MEWEPAGDIEDLTPLLEDLSIKKLEDPVGNEKQNSRPQKKASIGVQSHALSQDAILDDLSERLERSFHDEKQRANREQR